MRQQERKRRMRRGGGNAWVSGDTHVYGDMRVGGDSYVFGGMWEVSPLQIQGTNWFLNMASKTILRIGCQKHEIPVWLEQYQQIGREYGATEAEVQEYLLYIELAAKLYEDRRDLGCKSKRPESW